MKYYFSIISFCFFVILITTSCQNKIRISSETVVLINQYNGFKNNEVDTISLIIQKIYGVKTIIAKNQKLYSKAFVNLKSPRYRADSIIKFQKQQLNDSIDFILGLTDKDISTTKKDETGKIKTPEHKYKDWGIMGLAYCPGKSSVVSSFRLKHKNSTIYFDRLKKIAVHEFGHNLGLEHCFNKKCVMTDAVESISTIDNAELKLCDDCNLKIY